jgi:hypothetical protein
VRRRKYNFHCSLADVLTDESVARVMAAVEGVWKDRIYTPLVTLWVFLSQVLSADHSRRGAVARFLAHRLSQGQSPCSAETGAYCQARKRLPEQFFSAVSRLVRRALDAKVDSNWLWKGRRVYLFDGTTVSMPDNDATCVPSSGLSEADAGWQDLHRSTGVARMRRCPTSTAGTICARGTVTLR